MSGSFLEMEVNFQRSRLGKAARKRDGVIGSAHKKGRQARILQFRVGLFTDKLDSLKQKETIGCNIELADRKVADV